MTKIQCAECEAVFVIKFDESTTEGEITYCPFCGEKLNLKDDTVQPWYDEDEHE